MISTPKVDYVCWIISPSSLSSFRSLPKQFLISWKQKQKQILKEQISPTPNLFHFFCTSRVSFKFGVITMTAGIIGVPLGSYLSTKLGKNYPRSDPVICAVGLLISAPLLAGAMLAITYNSTLAYILVFIGEVALNCNWAVVADMLLVRFFQCHPSSFHFFLISFVKFYNFLPVLLLLIVLPDIDII